MSDHPVRILLLYTGGTIGMVMDMENESLVPFDFDYLLEKIPEIRQLDCHIDTDSLDKPIDSSNIKPEHWLRLAKRIEQNYTDYDGFVILHGSDTMAYTASALSFLLKNLHKPVILTGSQLPIGVARSDARENLLTTIEIAMARRKDGLAMVPEVCVYFEYDLFRGNRVHKMSTEDFEAFNSMNYPKLAEAGVNIKFNDNYILNPPKEALQLGPAISTEVGVLTVFPGITPEFVKAVFSAPMKGLIIRSFGAGNIPMDPWLIEAIQEVMDKGIYVVDVSQCVGGGVALGKYEASKALKHMGVISAVDMTFEAALTKLMYLLPFEFDYSDFRSYYESDLRGELTGAQAGKALGLA